jgi:hypothetical protein
MPSTRLAVFRTTFTGFATTAFVLSTVFSTTLTVL